MIFLWGSMMAAIKYKVKLNPNAPAEGPTGASRQSAPSRWRCSQMPYRETTAATAECGSGSKDLRPVTGQGRAGSELDGKQEAQAVHPKDM